MHSDFTSAADFHFNLIKKSYELTANRIDQFYQKHEKPIKFPVDIRGLVKEEGIEISEIDMNSSQETQLEYTHGKILPINTTKGGWRIYLEYTDSESMKRYMLAHEYGHYLIDVQNLISIEHCIDPFFSKKREELLADIMSAFLLFPHTLVLEAMQQYINKLKAENRLPLNPIKWLTFLGECAQVSTYQTIICYQYVKQYVCELWNSGNDEERNILTEYHELFR